ncbi:hypothetical protein FHR81_004755 [Actinoalloteichus hoggarensis]|uniref:Uncharacterized protein n=1 Tax=Actinoalloteichus hoggarensis TaxID=1470176 RepID=A0A221W4K6_9PSEU|nr:hypothetical protein AHOG_15010 [Actinoalloteichus hoggarensis]MBB5923684.1 hypothetical protein [Actinoalloteichus hoggarensis]
MRSSRRMVRPWSSSRPVTRPDPGTPATTESVDRILRRAQPVAPRDSPEAGLTVYRSYTWQPVRRPRIIFRSDEHRHLSGLRSDERGSISEWRSDEHDRLLYIEYRFTGTPVGPTSLGSRGLRRPTLPAASAEAREGVGGGRLSRPRRAVTTGCSAVGLDLARSRGRGRVIRSPGGGAGRGRTCPPLRHTIRTSRRESLARTGRASKYSTAIARHDAVSRESASERPPAGDRVTARATAA